MNDVLLKNELCVKEQLGLFKAASSYDILDPDTQEVLLECREENLGRWSKIGRFVGWSRVTPFDVVVRTPEGDQILRVKRKTSFGVSHVDMFDEDDERIGGFKYRVYALDATFHVLDAKDREVFRFKGSRSAREFSLRTGEQELAKVTQKWEGLAKEFLTTADNYTVTISPEIGDDDPIRKMIIGTVVCIDMVLKE